MNTPSSREGRAQMIANLAEGLEPVRQFKARDGALWVALAVAATGLGVYLYQGFWQGMLEGEAAPFFWVTNGLLLLVGLAATTAVVVMASPKVGHRYDAPRWAAAMIAVLPAAALTAFFTAGADHSHELMGPIDVHCLRSSLIASVITGGVLTYWLRKGAPVSTNLAGWFTGLAGGALGAFVYGLSCPLDTITHLGIAHVVPVGIAALIGRLVVPPLIRW